MKQYIEDGRYVTAKGRVYDLEEAQCRTLNDDTLDDFVAIDFETATPVKTSACALGMVKVIDGKIMQQFYTLINPVRDVYTEQEPNFPIHGLALETLEKAQAFNEMFDGIRAFIGGLPLICHNKVADIPCLESLMQYYGLSGIDTSRVVCTYQLTKLSLEKCCEKYNLPIDRHHNALWDAEMCARVYLEIIGKPIKEHEPAQNVATVWQVKKERNIDKALCQKLDAQDVKCKNTPFFDARVVITGVFDAYPDRNNLAYELQTLGAKINTSISRRTTHVVLGHDAGPSKLKTIEQLQASGVSIKIMKEDELLEILKSVR